MMQRAMFGADTLTCKPHPTRRDPSKTPARPDKTPLSTLTLSQFFSRKKTQLNEHSQFDQSPINL